MPYPITRRAACALGVAAMTMPPVFARHKAIEQWGLHEITLNGPQSGNPFADVVLTAVFDGAGKTVNVTGFYDGEGVYRLRFMPPAQGSWHYRTSSNKAELDGKSGIFEVVAPTANNHGPVAVANTYHFAYADGTPYHQFGTTSYVWTQQPDAVCEQTLKTLAASPFNKIRFALFPNEDTATVPLYPFAGSPPHGWDFTRFNPAFFRRFENYIGRLRDLGIEADVILFHPYDHGKWGFDAMPAEADDRYVRYVVARFAAYRNIWWSMANEYDDMKAKTDADFDRLFQIVRASDPYEHLRSIHNNKRFYNQNQPWVTHASVQNGSAVEDDARAVLYRDVWRKPVVFDEVRYEGDIAKRWGNLSGEELVRRFWEGTIAGTYVGHGESIGKQAYIWTGAGGTLRGTSPARLAFFRKLMDAGPAQIEPIDKWWDRHLGGVPGQYYLRYFGSQTPQQWALALPAIGLSDGQQFAVDIIDTWEMTVTPVPAPFTMRKADDYTFVGDRPVPLPQKPWIALRIRKV